MSQMEVSRQLHMLAPLTTSNESLALMLLHYTKNKVNILIFKPDCTCNPASSCVTFLPDRTQMQTYTDANALSLNRYYFADKLHLHSGLRNCVDVRKLTLTAVNYIKLQRNQCILRVDTLFHKLFTTDPKQETTNRFQLWKYDKINESVSWDA
jgi:hypothetical protein